MAAEIRGEAGAIEVEAKDGRIFKGSHLLWPSGAAPIPTGSTSRPRGSRPPKGIKVDASLRTTNRRVYAIGDVAGGCSSPTWRAITRG